LWRKCPYKEIIPEILASTPKSAGKNMKNSAIASFHGEQSAHYSRLQKGWRSPIWATLKTNKTK